MDKRPRLALYRWSPHQPVRQEGRSCASDTYTTARLPIASPLGFIISLSPGTTFSRLLLGVSHPDRDRGWGKR